MATTLAPSLASPTVARADHLFPTLTQAQIARITAHGQVRQVHDGDILVDAGSDNIHFFVVISGRIEVVQLSCDGEIVVAAHGPGQFSGEVNMLSGRRALA